MVLLVCDFGRVWLAWSRTPKCSGRKYRSRFNDCGGRSNDLSLVSKLVEYWCQVSLRVPNTYIPKATITSDTSSPNTLFVRSPLCSPCTLDMALFLTIIIRDATKPSEGQGTVPSAMAKYLDLLGPISGQRTPSVWAGHQVENPNTIQAMIRQFVHGPMGLDSRREIPVLMNAADALSRGG